MLGVVGLAGCAGPVETRVGRAGDAIAHPSPVAVAPVAIAAVTGAGDLSGPALTAVMQALARRGIAVADNAPARLTIALAERPAEMGVTGDDGLVLSAAKRSRLLQDCADRKHRLLLVLDRAGTPPVRAWAEEDHCKGTLAAGLTPLAERAVAALAGDRSGVLLRAGRD